MDNDKICIKDLKGNFLIPDYQRGYRWSKQEVGELLDDILEFNDFNGQRKYCLQTLMVIKRGKDEDEVYEVVDGQQRLTTIFIILSVAKRHGLPLIQPYSIKYATREGSKGFLESIGDKEKYDGNIDETNIDYYHITNAYRKIEEWLDDKADNENEKNMKLFNICSKILENVFFIYYSVPDIQKAKEVFRKVNLGKIPLSNSELIKAIIFNQDNFETDAEKKQQELSLDWNHLERELENDSFWWFITKDEKENSRYVTRIDHLFELVLLRRGYDLSYSGPDSEEQKQYKAFSYIYTEYKVCNNKNEYISNLWKDVNEVFEQLQEWYRNLNLYHIIGYLICAGSSVKDLIEESKSKKKSEIIRDFLDDIRKGKPLNKIIKDNDGEIRVDVGEVNYNSWEKKDLRLLFLFVNIATLICKNNREYRFPFDLLKTQGWDIEHIHATADDSDEADDDLENLTLLDLHTNREFKADIFSDKRKHVIKKDKEGRFIPICTKNVYLKEYTQDITDMDRWNDNDKNDYIESITDIIKEFFEGDFEDGDFVKKEVGRD